MYHKGIDRVRFRLGQPAPAVLVIHGNPPGFSKAVSSNMHELSLCRQMIHQVEAIAARHQANGVAAVDVRIGPLSGVEPHLLEQAFPFACAGSIAEGAELRLELTGVRVRCGNCATESAVSTSDLTCPACGDWHTQLISGDEMLLVSVELAG